MCTPPPVTCRGRAQAPERCISPPVPAQGLGAPHQPQGCRGLRGLDVGVRVSLNAGSGATKGLRHKTGWRERAGKTPRTPLGRAQSGGKDPPPIFKNNFIGLWFTYRIMHSFQEHDSMTCSSTFTDVHPSLQICFRTCSSPSKFITQ